MGRKFFLAMILGMIVLAGCKATLAAPSNTAASMEETERYQSLCSDEIYDYALDPTTARQIQHPYLKESLLDVWIKVTEYGPAVYTYPETYWLKHYYVRYSRPELQLLQTICIRRGKKETSGLHRPYREKNWVLVIPDSIEETLYQSILAKKPERQNKK